MKPIPFLIFCALFVVAASVLAVALLAIVLRAGGWL